MKHTKGPWGKVRCLASGRKRFHRIHSKSDMTIAILPVAVDPHYGVLDLESWANAYLIAAAPDLVKALKKIALIYREDSKYNKFDMLGAIKIAREAIAKAEGK